MRRPVARLGIVAMTIGLAGMLSTGGSGAQVSAPFTLLARADPAAIHLVAAQAPIVTAGELAFVTPSTAQARLDSLGTSQAFASAPYAGDFITTLPGTINGLGAGQLPPVPSFPFYVTSEHPTSPVGEFDAGPYGVRSESDGDSSTATAHAGLSAASPRVAVASATASVERDPDSGVVVATATSAVEPLAIGDLLRVGEVRSTARMTYDLENPAAGVQRESFLSIGTITVAGVELGLTDAGLSLGGATVLPVDPSLLTTLLAGVGVDFEYVPRVETPTSITSAAVRVSYTTEVPNLGATTVTVILGQSQVVADHGQPVTTPRLPSASPVAPVSTVQSGSTAGAPPPVSGSAAPLVPAATPTSTAVGIAPPAPSQPLFEPLSLKVARFYPVLALGGLVAALSTAGGTWRRAWSWIEASTGRTEMTDEA